MKKLPLTVKLAIVFLTIMVILGLVTIPHVILPVLGVVLTVVSLIRIGVYLVHDL